jgi:hypothetical protein
MGGLIMSFFNLRCLGIKPKRQEVQNNQGGNEMPEQEQIQGGDKPGNGEGHGGCGKHYNLCNDLCLTFGRIRDCFYPDGQPLKATGGATCGYAVNEGKIKHIKVAWKSFCDEVFETFALTVNGERVQFFTIDGKEGSLCVEVKEKVCDCDVVNIVSCGKDAGPDGKPVIPPACVTVSIWMEPTCSKKFHKEGDGLLEAIDTTGATSLISANVWTTKDLDTERNNTLPLFMQFLPAENCVSLRQGVYKIDYQSGVKFKESINIEYETKLQASINGGVWEDILQSGSVDYALGVGGNVSAGRALTYKVNRGDNVKIRIQERISADTSLQDSGAGAGIVIERVKNSIDL